jgi:hypothetical protein
MPFAHGGGTRVVVNRAVLLALAALGCGGQTTDSTAAVSSGAGGVAGAPGGGGAAGAAGMAAAGAGSGNGGHAGGGAASGMGGVGQGAGGAGASAGGAGAGGVGGPGFAGTGGGGQSATGGTGGSTVGNEDLPTCTEVTLSGGACSTGCSSQAGYDFCASQGYVCCAPWCRRGGVNDESKPPPPPTAAGICDFQKDCAPNGQIIPPLSFCPPLGLRGTPFEYIPSMHESVLGGDNHSRRSRLYKGNGLDGMVTIPALLRTSDLRRPHGVWREDRQPRLVYERGGWRKRQLGGHVGTLAGRRLWRLCSGLRGQNWSRWPLRSWRRFHGRRGTTCRGLVQWWIWGRRHGWDARSMRFALEGSR